MIPIFQDNHAVPKITKCRDLLYKYLYEMQAYETKNDPLKRLSTNCAAAAHSLHTLLELCTVGFKSSSEKKNERHEACAYFFELGMTFENKLTQIVPDIIGVLHFDDQKCTQ